MQFPRLVYKSPYKYAVVDTADAFDRHCEDGWYASVPEALEGKRPVKAAGPIKQ